MQFSTLLETQQSTTITNVFGGYNHNEVIQDGEFYNIENMTSDSYPLLRNRDQRDVTNHKLYTAGFAYSNGEIITHKYEHSIGFGKVAYFTLSSITQDPKRFVTFGSYIIIFPDMYYVNINDHSDKGKIESVKTISNPAFKYCDENGSNLTPKKIQSTEPTQPTDGLYWIDNSKNTWSVSKYSKSSAMWMPITPHWRFYVGSGFEEGDGIKLTFDGIESGNNLSVLNNKNLIIKKVTNSGTLVIQDDELKMTSSLDDNGYYRFSGDLTIEKKMPTMDFVIESKNRLWGCRYGKNSDGKYYNEIYASKLGDFKNWYYFAGSAADSYTASCGTGGEWTGAITHMGYPVFFKEDYIYKVYGDVPANFQLQILNAKGVKKGSHNSLVSINSYLYYESTDGYYVYDGSLPAKISDNLGDDSFGKTPQTQDYYNSGTCAGCYKDKYYVYTNSKLHGDIILVYDTKRGTWHKETVDFEIRKFCSVGDKLYFSAFFSGDEKFKLLEVKKTASVSSYDDDRSWVFETGLLGIDLPDHKYISRVTVRMSLDIDAYAMFYIQYDSCGEWEHVSTINSKSIRSFSLPVRPHRCDHFRMKIAGDGDVKIYSITKTLEEGSDV